MLEIDSRIKHNYNLALHSKWWDRGVDAVTLIWMILFFGSMSGYFGAWAEIAIWGTFPIFVFDLVVAYLRIRNFKLFLKKHWFTILITIPWLRVFRVARTLRVLRAARAAKGVKGIRAAKAIKITKLAKTTKSLKLAKSSKSLKMAKSFKILILIWALVSAGPSIAAIEFNKDIRPILSSKYLICPTTGKLCVIMCFLLKNISLMAIRPNTMSAHTHQLMFVKKSNTILNNKRKFL